MCRNVCILLLEQLKGFIEGCIKAVIENKVALKRHLVHPLFPGHGWLNHSWQRLVWFSLCCNLSPLLSGLSAVTFYTSEDLYHDPTVFSFVAGKEPGPFSVSQAQGALPVFFCSLTIWFLAYLEIMLQTEGRTPSEQSPSTDPFWGWYLLFLQPCDIAGTCSSLTHCHLWSHF